MKYNPILQRDKIMDLAGILDERIREQKLAILVFGPHPRTAADLTNSLCKLARKRIEIRESLRLDGHTAEFPEELLTGRNTPPKGQVLNYEELLAESHDLVVMLVASPGSNNEIGRFTAKTKLALKTQAFINEDYQGGLADDTCQALLDLGGESHYFKDPDDIDSCHLLGKVKNLVYKLQKRKFYS